jgi:hypothetical protein
MPIPRNDGRIAPATPVIAPATTRRREDAVTIERVNESNQLWSTARLRRLPEGNSAHWQANAFAQAGCAGTGIVVLANWGATLHPDA